MPSGKNQRHSHVGADTRRALTLSVAIIYDNFSAAARAQDLAVRLTDELKPDFELSTQAWGFNLLRYSQLREPAAKQVAEADVVIFSVSGSELPAHVKDWIEGWQSQKRGASALVALFDVGMGNHCEVPPLCEFLRGVAKGGGMDFFCNAEGWRQPGRAPVPQIKAPFPETPEKLAALSSSAGNGDGQVWHAWAIND